MPFFGDTHVHTALSFDAWEQGTLNRPREAYRFARGEEVGVQPYDAAGRPLRRVRLLAGDPGRRGGGHRPRPRLHVHELRRLRVERESRRRDDPPQRRVPERARAGAARDLRRGADR
ncbi:MAG: DUF3604 domain-containing protein [Myxococcales bacterium]|nr:MAG: DUF3604 domain-containing protein [Myxococcales bacterium]